VNDRVIECAIFDMDGLLIDSEPLWHIAEIEVFATVGVALGREDCLRTTGLRIDEVVRYWYRERPWPGCDVAATAAAVVGRVRALILERGAAKPGADHALAVARTAGLRLALASSSPRLLIDAVLARFGWRFAVVHSAEDEARGKPDPAVYLSAARLLGTAPAHCVAIEDSGAGVSAARAAGMRCVVVPDQPDPRTAAADVTLTSLLALTPAHLGLTQA
jgi:sugar-phosphatase